MNSRRIICRGGGGVGSKLKKDPSPAEKANCKKKTAYMECPPTEKNCKKSANPPPHA